MLRKLASICNFIPPASIEYLWQIKLVNKLSLSSKVGCDIQDLVLVAEMCPNKTKAAAGTIGDQTKFP